MNELHSAASPPEFDPLTITMLLPRNYAQILTSSSRNAAQGADLPPPGRVLVIIPLCVSMLVVCGVWVWVCVCVKRKPVPDWLVYF